jgi:hypothetical protein
MLRVISRRWRWLLASGVVAVAASLLLWWFGSTVGRALPLVALWETGRNPVPLQVQTLRSPPNTPASFIWWEAETPLQTNFPPANRNPFAPANPAEASVLSGGKWIGTEGKRADRLFLDYQVTVPQAADYFLYSRKFWQHGPFRWRWDDQPWQTIDRRVFLIDAAVMRPLVSVNWISLGVSSLATGSHRLRIELTEPEGAAAFDCFVLTRSPWQPRGKLQPNQRYEAQLTGATLFDPETDPVRPSAIDLRRLNEAYAGEHGWIRAKQDTLIHSATQQPERFWAVNVGTQALGMEPSQMKAMARFLAKKGVNLVRLHGALWSDDLGKISPDRLNHLFAFVAACKNEGIYTALSIYFPVWLRFDASSPFPGYTGQHPFGLLFFNPELQAIYRGWWQQILATPNPKTGLPLRDDPAVAMVELVNEDSYFFWTFDPYKTVPDAQMALLERQFGQWLTQQYGSLERVAQAWKSGSQPLGQVTGDRPDPSANQATVGILSPGQLVQQRTSQRAKDTARFLAASQQQFFTEAIAHLRQTLGYKGLIYASNWVTADAEILGPIDKYTNTVGDLMDRHGYFSGPHQGKRAAYSLNAGDTYRDQSALLFQSFSQREAFHYDLPIMDLRYNDLPSTITEVNWPLPNRFRADLPLLAARMGSSFLPPKTPLGAINWANLPSLPLRLWASFLLLL